MLPTRAKTLCFILIGIALSSAVVGLTIARTIKLHLSTPDQSTAVRGPIQNVRFAVYDAGIFPQQQRARPGNVTINLEDRTHRSTGLVIQSETGGVAASIGQVNPVVGQARGSTQFNLGAGRYGVVVWLRVVCEVWPWNVEPLNADRNQLKFGHKLQERWNNVGLLWLDEIYSEPIMMDVRAASIGSPK